MNHKILLVFALSLLFMGAVSGQWASSENRECRNVSVQGSQSLVDFPVPVQIPEQESMNSDFTDLRFYSEACGQGGTRLEHEFEKTEEDAFIWVSKDIDGDETFSVYYDNDSTVSSVESPETVWESFSSVHHLEQEVSGDGGLFTGVLGLEAEALNGVDTSSEGVFDGAYSFSGEDEVLNFSENFRFSDSESFTVDFSFWKDGMDYESRILGFDNSWNVSVDQERLYFNFNDSNISTALEQEKFHTTSLRFNGSHAEIFIDGERENVSEASWDTPVNDFLVGESSSSFNGTVDELRVSETDRSDDWINYTSESLEQEAELSEEVMKTEIDILTPEKFENREELNISVSSDPEASLKYSIDDGPTKLKGLESIFYSDSGLSYLEKANNSIVSKGLDVAVQGNTGNFDADIQPEYVYVNSTGYLKSLDAFQGTETVETGVRSSNSSIAVADIGSGPSIYYADENNQLYRTSGDGESSLGIEAEAVLGSADMGAESEELVFVDEAGNISTYRDTVSDTGFSGFNSTESIGAGLPADFNGNTTSRIPVIVDQTVGLVSNTGDVQKLNTSYSQAIGTRPAPVNWTQTDEKEVAFIDKEQNINLMFLNGTIKEIDLGDYPEVSTGLSSGLIDTVNQTKTFEEGEHTLDVSGGPGFYGEASRDFAVDTTPPELEEITDNASDSLLNTETVNISGKSQDTVSGLSEVILSTNESGSFSNLTEYGSPQSFEESKDQELSEFFWTNSSFSGTLSYRLWASDSAGNYRKSDKSSFNVTGTDLEASNISFNSSDPVENTPLGIEVNVTNNGGGDVETGVKLEAEKFNGSEWVSQSKSSENITLDGQETVQTNFSFTPETGPYRFKTAVDPGDNVSESDETNNNLSELLDVPAYQLNYGDSNSFITLKTDDGGNSIKDWENSASEGTIFYADEEASYSIGDLKPLNESGDLEEASNTLGMSGYNDSISEVYDEDQDGLPDTTGCIVIAGDEVCEIPLVNSTNTSSFQTGVMYDAEDGEGFDGSQDIVFLTQITREAQGKYGEYNYEASVPSRLSTQYDPHDFIKVRVELS